MKTVSVRDVVIGAGRPKICVPIVGITRADILKQAEDIAEKNIDIIEWRVDWYEGIDNFGKTMALLDEVRKIIRDIPLLFTFRTKAEGGEQNISEDIYFELYKNAAATGLIDLLDIEWMQAKKYPERIKEYQDAGVKVILSNHDFHQTPAKEELVFRLKSMQELGGDVLKIAVMPRQKMDVITLLEATVQMDETYAKRPIVTMSMGKIGMISRLAGELSGSAITFGAIGKISAPGQINAENLHKVLDIIHNS